MPAVDEKNVIFVLFLVLHSSNITDIVITETLSLLSSVRSFKNWCHQGKIFSYTGWLIKRPKFSGLEKTHIV